MIFERIKLEADEEVIAVLRRHWFFLLKQSLFVIVLIVLPLFGFFLLSALPHNSALTLVTTYAPHLLFLYLLWLLINWTTLASIWTDHYLDIWAITNRRVIKIDQVSFFKRQVASFRLERLQDLSVEIDGILATLLNFGTIHATTAGTHHEEFTASYLPNPEHIKSIILEAADKQIPKTTL